MKDSAPSCQTSRQWMVIYTRSKYEKKVYQSFTDRGITSFCPLVKATKKWADRNKVIEVPLFPSYLFVHLTSSELSAIRQTPGVVNYVSHCGKPATITNNEIERVKQIVGNYTNVEAVSLKQLNIGDKVTINDGPLTDCNGEIIKVQGKSVLLIVNSLDCALLVKVKPEQIDMHLV